MVSVERELSVVIMPERILITGGTGFLGSHVAEQLLDEGYNVRLAARGAKIPGLLEVYAQHVTDGRMEITRIMDLANEQFITLFVGVDALIHMAAPQVGREHPECTLRNTVDGSLNVIRQAERAGIKKIIVTSAAATAFGPKGKVSDQEWNPVDRGVALQSGNPLAVFTTAKTLAEKAIWDFASSHPHVEFTTINPTIIYGPLAKSHKVPKSNPAGLSTNILVYRLLFPTGAFPTTVDHVDVRDVARAHVLALKSPPTFIVGRKRIIIGSPHVLDFGQITQLIREKRPGLAERLTKVPVPTFERLTLPINFGRIEDVLGMSRTEFHTVESTFLDALRRLWKHRCL